VTLRLTRLLTLVLLLIACGSDVPASQKPAAALRKEDAVKLSRSADGYTGTLEWRAGTEMISLRVAPVAAADGPPLSMSRRIELWRPLLGQLFTEHGRRKTYLLTVGEYPELAPRMAAAAACSDKWDLKTGRPLASGNGAIVDLLSDARLYRELGALMTELGYDVAVQSAEAVVLCSWEAVADRIEGCSRTPPATAKVPCGASIVFRLTARP